LEKIIFIISVNPLLCPPLSTLSNKPLSREIYQAFTFSILSLYYAPIYSHLYYIFIVYFNPTLALLSSNVCEKLCGWRHYSIYRGLQLCLSPPRPFANIVRHHNCMCSFVTVHCNCNCNCIGSILIYSILFSFFSYSFVFYLIQTIFVKLLS
jgi:hypothetical protein